MWLTVCAEEISRTKKAKRLKVRIEVQYIERVIQTLPVYLKLLAFHFQDQLFTEKKNFKNYGAQFSPTNVLTKALNQMKKEKNKIN